MVEYRFYVHDFQDSAEKVSSILDFPNSIFSDRGERDLERDIPRRNSVSFSISQGSGGKLDAEKAFIQELEEREDKLLKIKGGVSTKIAIICSNLDDYNTHITLSFELIDLSSRLGCEIDFFVNKGVS